MAGITSSRLKEKKEAILTLWAERSIKEVHSATNTASLALRNTLPIFLDHLSEALATNLKMDVHSVLERDLESVRIGKLHGAERAGNRSYVLTEVIFEYHILREVIFQVLEVEGPLSNVQRDIILDSIEQAVNDAAVKFSEVHADIQEKFVTTLTHDLKNPLTAAKMNAQLIIRCSDKPEVCIASASRIIASLNRLNAMIHDLLDASRIRAGEPLTLQLIQCDLDLVIHEIVDEMSTTHGNRFILDSKEPVKGYWDCDGLKRAIENLIENAVKYGTSTTPITISLRPGKTALEITVHNQGPVIPENEILFLFQQYRRAKNAQEGSKAGWGLGLTVVKGVVDAHNGKVRVESTVGNGTSFILEIPYAESNLQR